MTVSAALIELRILKFEQKLNKKKIVHYYNYMSDGWNSNIYPRPRFASEYGFQSFPSLASWKQVLRPGVDRLSDLIAHRQHFPIGGSVPVWNLIKRHLPLPGGGSPLYNEALLYFSQVSQAMTMRAETEAYR